VVDITLRKSLAARQEEWLSRSGQPRTGKCWVAVLDDCDPDFKGKSEYQDTVTVYDTEGVERSRFVGLNTCETVGGNHAIAWNALDRSLWVVELVGHRLLKFDEHVRLVWGKDELEASALAVDPKTGNVWVLTSAGTIYGAQVLVLDPTGQVVHQWDVGALDIAYSEHDDCFWLVGKKVWKMSREGRVLFQTPEEFAWVAVSVGVSDADGSVWVTERRHPQAAGSRNRLFVFEPDGKVRTEVDLEHRWVISSVAVDNERQCAWVATFQGVLKFSLTGELLVDVPIAGFSLAVEPDTGYVWVGSRSGLYRLDGQGNLVWSKASPANSQKWLSATAR
jgi:DNA-binding beta-propeller fold protein YncE